MSCPRLFAVASALVLLAPQRASAQEPARVALRAPDCVDGLPRSAFRLVLASLTADETRAAVPEAAWTSIKVATSSIAWQVRGLLGAADGDLPKPDTLLTWRSARHAVLVGAWRDGRMAVLSHGEDRDGEGRVVADLLAAGIERALARGERFGWPPGLRLEDSVVFNLSIDYAEPRPGLGQGLSARHAEPLLQLSVPRSKPAVPAKMAPIRYPETSLRGGARGTVVMQFTVDTTGRAAPETIRSIWRSTEPPPSGVLADYYRDFIAAVTQGVRASRYLPAEVGSCKVKQLVEQPFEFVIER